MATKYNTFTTPQPFRLRWSVKLQKKVTEGAQIATTDYQTGFQYLNGELQFFPTAEGYVKSTIVSINLDGSSNLSYDYVYNHTDHLGNIRISYTQDPNTGNLKILEENNYYPFGLKHGAYNSLVKKISADATKTSGKTILTKPYFPSIIEVDYNYKYNGKELQTELGLGLYDLGFRHYDPAIGRMLQIDPMTSFVEYQSPYVMADDNPVLYIDDYGLGIFNAIGNIFKRIGNGIASLVPRNWRQCGCNPTTKESLADAWKRPDFNRSGRSRSRNRSPNNNTKLASNTPEPTRNATDPSPILDMDPPGLVIQEPKEPSFNIQLPEPIVDLPKPSSNSGTVTFGDETKPGDKHLVPISFSSNTTTIRETGMNDKALNDLLTVMQGDPKLNILIMGNVAYQSIQGKNDNTTVNLNGGTGTIRQLKIGRARAVERFLINRGISPSRIKVGVGRTGTTQKDLSTTIIFK